jgi:hypothetical protein
VTAEQGQFAQIVPDAYQEMIPVYLTCMAAWWTSVLANLLQGVGAETCLRKSPKDTASRFWVFPGGAELALGRAKRAAFGEKVPMTSGNSTKYIPFGGSEVDGRDRLIDTGNQNGNPALRVSSYDVRGSTHAAFKARSIETISETCAPTPQRDKK